MNDIKLYENISELEQNFPVKIRRYIGKYLQPHWHEHIEMLHILSGHGKILCASSEIMVSAGETVFVNSGELHSFINDEKLDYICVIVNPSIFNFENFENTIIRSLIPKDEFVAQSFTDLYNHYTNPQPSSPPVILGKLYLLYAHFTQNYASMRLSNAEYDARIKRMKRANTILDYIHKNYSKDITTARLAEIFFLSESYMCRMFKDAVGSSITDYINRYRIDKASFLLESTNDRISDIAENVGFVNLNYFDRVFKKYKYVSPKLYRIQKNQVQ